MKKIQYWFPVLLWMGVIFTFSSYQTIKSTEVYIMDFIFKKTVHMIEYGILWGLSFRAMKKTSKISFKHAGWLAIAIVVLYAMSDEWHQTFTPSREGTIRDVIIDTLGASIIFGMVVLMRKKLTFKQK